MLGVRKATMTYHKYYFYYTNTSESATDLEIADMLDVDVEDFRESMSEYNANFDREYSKLMFDNKDDAENALNSLNQTLSKMLH